MAADDESVTPWRWHADRAPWSRRVAAAAEHWEPAIRLSCSASDVLAAIERAAEAGPDRLYDPRVIALTHHRDDGRASRELNLVTWLADRHELDGDVHLDAPEWLWSRDGGVPVAAGSHHLADLARRADAAPETFPVPWLDPWCTILGYAHADSVPASGRSEPDQEEAVRHGALVALRAVCLLHERSPDLAQWLATYAKVLVYLDDGGRIARSASSADLPGIVFADATTEVALLELLVHESAHHLLYLEESASPLVDPNDDRRFESPLRADARPLRGILLAYHALAYICALYAELASSDIGRAFDPADVASLRAKAEDAAATIDAASDGLTDAGARFVHTTTSVLRYADRTR